jgi:hypothetical protein
MTFWEAIDNWEWYCENKKSLVCCFVFFFVKLIYTKQTRLKKGSWSIPVLIFRVLLFEHLNKDLLGLHFFVEKSVFHIISRVLKELIEDIGNTPRVWLKGSQSFSDQAAKLRKLDTKRFVPARFLQAFCPKRHKVRNLGKSRWSDWGISHDLVCSSRSFLEEAGWI